jgi:hypothetical protein
MRYPILVFMLLLQMNMHGSDTVLLHGQQNQEESEGILVWVRDDGLLLSDSGIRTPMDLLTTCKVWISQGTKPSVIIVLFPKLKSNRDLLAILPLMQVLQTHDVAFHLQIQSADAVPEPDLVTKK